MTTPPDRTFADVLSNLPENNVGSITPADVGAIANLAKTSTFHDGVSGTGTAVLSPLFDRYIPAGSAGTDDDIYYARLMRLNGATAGGGGTSLYRSTSGDLSATDYGVQYSAPLSAQPRVFTYSWDLAVQSGKQSFWSVTFYYLPSGGAWPDTPKPAVGGNAAVQTVDGNWSTVKPHYSEPFWANEPVEYGAATATSAAFTGTKWVAETSGSRTIVLEPGDTLVPVVEYWGAGTAGDAPASMDTNLIKWSLDVVSMGVAAAVPQDDPQYWSTVSNRAATEALLNPSTSVDTATTMTSRPIFIDNIGASELPVTSDVVVGTTVYLTGEKRLLTYRGGGALTDWVEVANLNAPYADGPRLVAAATASLPASTAMTVGTVAYDTTTKELKVADGANFYVVKDLDLATSGTSLPTSGTVGQQFYLTATSGSNYPGLYTYTSATVGWTKPWDLPWGVVGSVRLTTPPASLSTNLVATDIAGMVTPSFVPVLNRVYRVTSTIRYSASVATQVDHYIYFGGGVGAVVATATTGNISNNVSTATTIVENATAVATTVKSQWMLGSSATLTPSTSAASPWTLVVEDIGPKAAPAS